MSNLLRISLILVLLSVLAACKKMDERVADFLPGNTWEITSLNHNGVEVLDAYYKDSCLCKKLYFSTYPQPNFPNQYSVYFYDCSNGQYGFSSKNGYSIISTKPLKERKYAVLSFNNFGQSIPSCTCGRYGTASIFTISALDEKKQTWTMIGDLADGRWQINFKKVE